MEYGRERLASALLSDTPQIIGMLVNGVVHKLESWRGTGRDRVFVFYGSMRMSYVEVLRAHTQVVLRDPERQARLYIKFSSRVVLCPACKKLIGSCAFFNHYNAYHAVRAFWLNKVDWEAMLKGPYQPPPEER